MAPWMSPAAQRIMAPPAGRSAGSLARRWLGLRRARPSGDLIHRRSRAGAAPCGGEQARGVLSAHSSGIAPSSPRQPSGPSCLRRRRRPRAAPRASRRRSVLTKERGPAHGRAGEDVPADRRLENRVADVGRPASDVVPECVRAWIGPHAHDEIGSLLAVDLEDARQRGRRPVGKGQSLEPSGEAFAGTGSVMEGR